MDCVLDQLQPNVPAESDDNDAQKYQNDDSKKLFQILNLSDGLPVHDILIPVGHHLPQRFHRVSAVGETGCAFCFPIPADFIARLIFHHWLHILCTFSFTHRHFISSGLM